MRSRGRVRRFVGTVLTTLLTVSLLSASHPTSEPASCTSEALRPVGDDLSDTMPVVFVHGIRADRTTWDPSQDALHGDQVDAALPELVDALGGVSAWTFDYGEHQPNWVTDDGIGPELGRAVSCLADTSGYDVMVVAHSMGGLAARVAVSQPHPNGGLVADRVAEVITIGTPHRGSYLLSLTQEAVGTITAPELDPELGAASQAHLLQVLAERLLVRCARGVEGLDEPCSAVSILRTPQGEALTYDSEAIGELPEWPETVPVRAVAGDVAVGVPFSDEDLVSVGDIIVTLDSAIAHHTAGGDPLTVSCRHDRVGLHPSKDRVSLWKVALSPCEHGRLKWHPEVVDAVVDGVTEQWRLQNAEPVPDHEPPPYETGPPGQPPGGDPSGSDEETNTPLVTLGLADSTDPQRVEEFYEELVSHEGEEVRVRFEAEHDGEHTGINLVGGGSSGAPRNGVWLNASCVSATRYDCHAVEVRFPESLVPLEPNFGVDPEGTQELDVDEVFRVTEVGMEGDPEWDSHATGWVVLDAP